jgi:hypothetical protein
MPTGTETDPSKAAADAAAADKPFTRADAEALIKGELTNLGNTVNASVRDHLKRADLGGQIARGFEPFKAFLPKAPVEGAEPGDEAGDEAARAAAATAAAARNVQAPALQGARQPDPEIELLKKNHAEQARKLAGVQGELTKEREGRAKAERERVEEAGYGALRAELTGKVLPGTEGDIVDLLRARKRVHITEDGRVLLKLGQADEPEEGLPFKDGIERHLKTPEVKHFLPAPTAGPLGRRPAPQSLGGTVPRVGANGQKLTPSEAFEARFGRSLDSKL